MAARRTDPRSAPVYGLGCLVCGMRSPQEFEIETHRCRRRSTKPSISHVESFVKSVSIVRTNQHLGAQSNPGHQANSKTRSDSDPREVVPRPFDVLDRVAVPGASLAVFIANTQVGRVSPFVGKKPVESGSQRPCLLRSVPGAECPVEIKERPPESSKDRSAKRGGEVITNLKAGVEFSPSLRPRIRFSQAIECSRSDPHADCERPRPQPVCCVATSLHVEEKRNKTQRPDVSR